MLKIGLPIIILLLLLSVGCSSDNAVDDSQSNQVTAVEAKKMIDERKIQVIDVRTPEEFNAGHIPGAKSIPLQEIEQRMDELNKDQAYLLVCRSGSRSLQAQVILEEHGFMNTFNMLEGIAQWPYETVK